MTVVLPVTGSRQVAGAPGWRPHLAVLAATAMALLLLLRSDAADMVAIWIDSSTFNHCLLILPIIAWLVWQRLPDLRQLRPAAWLPGLGIVAMGATFWLLGWAGSIGLARHLGLVVMVQGLVIACLGKAVTRGLAFPLFYAFFLVPAGEELVPLMQNVTAHICMVLLGVAGIPAHLEGVFISTPNGYFEVAEACSGVKFLLAMIAYGALVANVCFLSWRRRALFMAASVIVPVLANGVRAWATILVATWTNTQLAVDFDHIFYGWIFFAIVITLLMGAGWRFFDRIPSARWFDPDRLQRLQSTVQGRVDLPATACAALALAAAPVLWAGKVAASAPPSPLSAQLPPVAGWTQVENRAQRPWRPHFAGADDLAMASYRDAQGRQVELAVAVFGHQEEGREVVGFGQGAVGPDSEWTWTSQDIAPAGGRLDRIVSFGTVREVATFYRVGKIVSGSEARVKLETAKTRLSGGPQTAVAVIVSAEQAADGASARPAIDNFLSALGPIGPFADQSVETR